MHSKTDATLSLCQPERLYRALPESHLLVLTPTPNGDSSYLMNMGGTEASEQSCPHWGFLPSCRKMTLWSEKPPESWLVQH